MRRHWLDNLRWTIVLFVLLYHVFYFYNNKGVLGGIGGFSIEPTDQPQDVLLYILYPWFMMLMFLIAGISARYSLERSTEKEFIKSRTTKLLVPTLLGPLLYHWITGYFNLMSSPIQDDIAQIPIIIRWLIFSVVGQGPLWFIQDLLFFSVLLLLFRKIDSKDKLRSLCSKVSMPIILLLGVLVYLGSQFMIFELKSERPFDNLINLYRPVAYLIPFLMGYFVFSNDKQQESVKKYAYPLAVGAFVAGIIYCTNEWGKNYTSPDCLASWQNCLYAWLMMLAMMGIFLRCFDRTSKSCEYLKRISFGLYILHYPIVVSFGYMLKNYTSLSPWLIYLILILIVFFLTPLVYELFHRIPFIRWAIMGEKTKD